MTEEELNKLIAKLTEVVATKEDLKDFAKREDLENLATKEDVRDFEKRLIAKIANVDKKLEEVDKKADTILVYADAIDETTTSHEKRLNKLEKSISLTH